MTDTSSHYADLARAAEPRVAGPIEPESLVAILQATPDFVAMATPDGEMLFLNDGARAMVGLPPSSDGQGFDIPQEARQVGAYRRPDWARRKLLEEGLPTARRQGVWHGQTALFNARGEEITVSHTVLAHFNAAGEVVRFSTIMRDITELVRVKGELQAMAYYNRVTGLPNRQAFHDRMADALAGQAARAGQLAVLVAEPERFGEVVQSFGRDVADTLLQGFADALRRAVGESAFLAHVAENTFAVVLPGLADHQNASAVAWRIRRELDQPLVVSGWRMRRQAQIGIAVYPDHGTDSRDLLRHAEVARSAGRGARGGGSWFADPDLSAAVRQRVELIEALQRALERGEVGVHYQPIIDAPTGRILGLEALARWYHRRYGWVSPSTFVPLAEEAGLIDELGNAVLDRTIADLAAWADQGLVPPRVSVNVSVENLCSAGFVEVLLQRLSAAEVPRQRVELEVTESLLAESNPDAVRTLTDLREAGIAVAIDDFGTGYSSLAQVRRLPADRLKIDRAFIQALPGEAPDRSVVEAIARLADGLGLAVVAEGVENEEQCRHLAALGVRECQGFHFARPEPPTAVAKRLG